MSDNQNTASLVGTNNRPQFRFDAPLKPGQSFGSGNGLGRKMLQPAVCCARRASSDLLPGKPLPAAKVHLPKARTDLKFDFLAFGDRAGCRDRTSEVACKNRLESKPGELSGKFLQLPSPFRTEGFVLLTDEFPRTTRCGVPHEDQGANRTCWRRLTGHAFRPSSRRKSIRQSANETASRRSQAADG